MYAVYKRLVDKTPYPSTFIMPLPDGDVTRDSEQEFFKINFSRKDRDTHANLRLVTFADGNFRIAYIPSLNLSGYGNTESEAMSMLMDVVVKEYLIGLMSLTEAQIMAELRQYGWKRRPYLSKQLLNTEFLSTEKIIEDFNLPADTRFNERFVTA